MLVHPQTLPSNLEIEPSSSSSNPVAINSDRDVIIKEKIGHGKSSYVYRCISSIDNNQTFAIKKMRYGITYDFAFHSEITSLEDLKHANIMKKICSGDHYIILEYVPNGEIFDYIATARGFKAEMARFYFKQIISAIEYIHSSGYAHRDIKLENILLDENFDLKLGDFGFCVKMCAERNLLGKILGTEGYMCPELQNQNSFYNPQKADIFALGVTLFSMFVGIPPFLKKSDSSDPYYKYFIEENHEGYWKNLERKIKFFPNAEFKDLINGMLAANPAKRFTIQEVQNHPFLKGEVLEKEAVIAEMKILQQKIKSQQ